ncbi:MAG TPA: efflux RND transporter periplasmic adaptor subunit [Hanamia sp.]|nr:efflux RND transporter periplasmic adaptor subunit [Hanamia sp.]
MIYKKIKKGNFLGKKLMQLKFCLQLSAIGFLLSAIIPLLISSCKEKKKTETAVVQKALYYTCSMHPQVHADKPGNCPICGMKLIAVVKTSNANTTQIHLSAEQIHLGNIQTDTIEKSNIGDKLVLTGTLNFNQDKLTSVNARVEGRIDKLYFKNMGDYVKKGDKVYDIYSEELNNAKQDYVNALEQENTVGNSLINYATLVESAKTKLLLWGMTNAQITRLGQSKQVPTHTTFYSTQSGYITSLNANEGDYVMEGGTVLQLADLSTLWAEAQVYTTQMSFINRGENASVQIPDLNNQIINGKIDFISPEMNPDSRINLVRLTITNKNNQLHPGMPVYITISKAKHQSIILPSDAVLRDSDGAIVWIQTNPGVYEMRMVKTGIDENDAIEITSGLETGEVVVTGGAYLLNSEYIFEHGSNSMAGMDMANMKMGKD